MAEDEMMFDPTMKKKKKKKKMPLDLDGFEADSANQEVEKTNEPEEIPEKDISLDLDDFSDLKKKKKKKKKVFDMEGLDTALSENTGEPGDKGGKDDDQGVDDFDLSLPMKKKKKKKKIIDIDAVPEKSPENGADSGEEEAENYEDINNVEDRDYTYDELLDRVFEIMRAKNPDMVAGEKRKFVMKPPQVLRIGSKKTSFANFTDICKILHRQPKHLLAFLLAELGTSGSCDGNNQLIIKGRFQQKQIETVLRRYIKEYVTCHTCRSPDTILQKETRLFFLQCETCGSRCSVASIKSGFQAITGKRAQLKNKQQ
ncbi:eukaryotic translation initiation factor 2 subunit 2 [Exaiptasia diaphana]|uniref:Eukaryotic translation initiation factor 2 subunit 2 n=1 Tax=Exaiptasia diaphana TaxID=2652724 RepID=A0A913XW86_EXADI|nr:eukaryotic translation initiation factor 2 subunit 2 [Exaiptasia diaphana]KXJ24270.1 Eukaryotic translation initiation factor 2 subunit 2 [Exaiptasia diaphana]